MAQTIDLVIPTFNARQLLEKNLPIIIKNSPQVRKIIIIDNGSNDGTKQYLESIYPSKIICFRNSKNQFFPKAVNQGFKHSDADLIVLINNDVLPQKNYLTAALKHFANPEVFAVTLHETSSSWPLFSFSSGKFQFTHGVKSTKPIFSAWASGGSAIFRKKIWDKLGGFNEIYTPGYWEDIDLGFKAWKAGFKIIWEPSALVEHHHESSFKKLNPNYINLIKQRNELLFIWQNLTDFQFWLSHFWFLFSYTLLHPGYLQVLFLAFKSLSQFKRIKINQISDRQVLRLVNKPVSND